MNSTYQVHIPPGMLLRAIQYKQNRIVNCEQLLSLAVDQEDTILIRDILIDEKNHFNNFSTLYFELFNEQPIIYKPETPQIGSFSAGVKKSIIEEINLYRFYSNIYFFDTDDRVRNTFLQALVDENIHSTIFNYIFTKYLFV